MAKILPGPPPNLALERTPPAPTVTAGTSRTGDVRIAPEPTPAPVSAPKAQLGGAELGVALSGLAGLLDAAARASNPAKSQAASRTATKQLEALDPAQVAALSPARKFALGARLADALHGLRDSGRSPEGFEALIAAKLDALPFLSAKPTASRGPGLVHAWGPSHDSFLFEVTRDPAQAKLVGEVLEANPHPAGAVLDALAGGQRRNQAIQKLTRMYPGAEAFGGTAALVAKLEGDLSRGNIADDLRVGMMERGLSEPDIQAFFGAFAEVRQAFEVGAKDGDDMQRTNWIHTRIEILHTLEAGHALKLSREETLAALYGSLFSDAFKDAGVYSVAQHNRPGAEWIAPLVMSRHLDLTKPENEKLLDQAMRVAHEHQVTPPLFMAGAVRAVLADPADDAKGQALVEGIAQKLLAPMQQPQTGGELRFTPREAERLLGGGLLGWAVPHPSEHRRASMAAIVGDVWQYVSPDGLMKYTHDLRDPDHPVPLFRDPIISMRYLELARPLLSETLKGADNPVRMGAAESSLHFSFDQGLSVLPKEDAALAAFMRSRQDDALAELERRVYPEVERRLRESLGLPPGAPLPDVPYWNQPVSVSEPNPPEVRSSIDLVKRTMEAVLADLGNVPRDPFGTRKEAS